MRVALSLLVATLLLSSCATTEKRDNGQISRDEQLVLSSDGFLDAHPDLQQRLDGWIAYDEGRFEEAVGYFKQAALYADKLSQAMLAEMYWNGQGVPVDRPLAYAWADLAAERGYVQFLAVRERYWQALDAGERAEAIKRGQALLHEYGDAVARPRMAEALINALWDVRRTMPGLMIRRSGKITLPGPKGPVRVNASAYYAAKFWRPKRYQAWQDEVWSNPLPSGTVTVQPLETVKEEASESAKPDVQP